MATTFDEDRKARTNNFGDAAAATTDPTVKPVMLNKTAPGTMAPRPEAYAPKTGPGLGFKPDQFMPDTQAVYKESGKAISDLINQGRYGAAAGETARAALSYVPAVVNDVAVRPLAGAGKQVWDGVKQFVGINDSGSPGQPTTTPATPKPVTPGSVNSSQNPGAAPSSPAPTTAMPTEHAPSPSAKPSVPAVNGYTDLGNGIYRKGNEFTDQVGTGDARFAARGTAITPQNMRAADALAAKSASEIQATAALGFHPANQQTVQAQPTGTFDRAASIRALTDLTSPEYRALRALKMDAESEAEQRSRQGRGFKGTGAGEAYNALLSELTTGTRQGQTAEMQDTGATTRAGMQERGALQRTGLQESGAMVRAGMNNDVQRGELALKQGEFGMRQQIEKRLQTVQDELINADTPEKQAVAQRKLQALTGRGHEKFTVVRGGQEFDDRAGVMRNLPDMVIDSQGQPIAMGGQQTQPRNAPQYVKGQVYVDASGQRAKWDGKTFVPAN